MLDVQGTDGETAGPEAVEEQCDMCQRPTPNPVKWGKRKCDGCKGWRRDTGANRPRSDVTLPESVRSKAADIELSLVKHLAMLPHDERGPYLAHVLRITTDQMEKHHGVFPAHEGGRS